MLDFHMYLDINEKSTLSNYRQVPFYTTQQYDEVCTDVTDIFGFHNLYPDNIQIHLTVTMAKVRVQHR